MEQKIEKMDHQTLTLFRNSYKYNYDDSIDAAIGAGLGAAVVLAGAAVFALLAANVAKSTLGVVSCSIVAGLGGLISLGPIMGGCWPYACEAYQHSKNADRFDAEIQRRAEEKRAV